MSPLEKLIMKKREEGKQMDPLEQKAKLDNLAALRDEMASMMKGDLEPSAKVEVAADSPDALKEGLDKAKDVVEAHADDMDADSDSEDSEEKPEAGEMIEDSIKHEAAEGELSPEEIDQLQMLLAKLKQSKMS